MARRLDVRTSWMSREVIVLPAFIAVVALWAYGAGARRTGARCVGAAVAARSCSPRCCGMHRDDLRLPALVQEWAHPLTIVNYTLIGLSSGLRAGWRRWQRSVASRRSPRRDRTVGAAVTLAAWACRSLALRRNARRPEVDAPVGHRHPRRRRRAAVDGPVRPLVKHARVFPPASRAALRA